MWLQEMLVLRSERTTLQQAKYAGPVWTYGRTRACSPPITQQELTGVFCWADMFIPCLQLPLSGICRQLLSKGSLLVHCLLVTSCY